MFARHKINCGYAPLATYTAQFFRLLSQSPIQSHVRGLDNVTHIKNLLAMSQISSNKILSGFLPKWLTFIFNDNFGWHSFSTKVLDEFQLESEGVFKGPILRQGYTPDEKVVDNK